MTSIVLSKYFLASSIVFTSGNLAPCPVGFSPINPVHEAGIRIEPPISLPLAIETIPLATAPALPPEEPPVFRLGSQGFPAGPNNLESVIFLVPNSG